MTMDECEPNHHNIMPTPGLINETKPKNVPPTSLD